MDEFHVSVTMPAQLVWATSPVGTEGGVVSAGVAAAAIGAAAAPVAAWAPGAVLIAIVRAVAAASEPAKAGTMNLLRMDGSRNGRSGTGGAGGVRH
ncbi:hypothetical protein GCM10009682_18730 [Luedemannella flava]|uniref:Uncharacterized protein n=1 Tax=Luedemannella flava TaxID=349316 RepID=A0ABN2LRJ5_9ACTN